MLMVQQDGASLLHHLKHHDATQLPTHRHGHVGEGRQLVQELQQLLCLMPEDREPVCVFRCTLVRTFNYKKDQLHENPVTVNPVTCGVLHD